MTESKEQTNEPPKERVEFVDSALLRGLGLALATYYLSYSLLSLLFGNQFAAFIATPLSALAYFLTARWDRLRDANTLSTDSLKSFVKFEPIIVFYGGVSIFLLGVLTVVVFAFVLFSYDPDLGESLFSDWPSGLDALDSHAWWFFLFYVAAFLPYFLGGFIAGRIARRRKVSAAKHAVLSSIAVLITNLLLMNVNSLLTTGEYFLPDDNETAFGVPVFLMSMFVLLPIVGASLAMRVPMSEPVLATTANIEEWNALVASESQRLAKNDADAEPSSRKRRISSP